MLTSSLIAVIACQDDLREIAEEYASKGEFYHLFETPSIYLLNERLAEKEMAVCFMAEYYLPDKDNYYDKKLYENLTCDYELRVLTQPDFADLYLPEWSNAICKERKELDVLGVGAYDEGKLVGLAACSSDAEEMWQIGIDVLPDYRKKGVAHELLLHILCVAKARGKKRASLTCKESLIGFYESFGFRNHGVSKSVIGDVISYDMEINL